MSKKKTWQIVLWIVLVIMSVLMVLVVLNKQWILDYWRSQIYQPTSEVARMRDKLALTSEGEFLFNASWPELNNSDDFNSNCRFDMDAEVAVLGCYADGNIYVFDIQNEELDGIRELTMAHELLHAAYGRMTESEKNSLSLMLDEVYQANKEAFDGDIGLYDNREKSEEIYVRAGTEFRELPEPLERHYAKYFIDQDKIVDYYNKYISVFRGVKAELDVLSGEMEGLRQEIEQKTENYKTRATQLEAEITSFNTCAETEGCFSNNFDFYTRRNVLVTEQDALNVMYDELNGLINQYNEKVEKYNENAIYSEKLNNMINSLTKVEELE